MSSSKSTSAPAAAPPVEKPSSIRIGVLAFARLRELIAASEESLELPAGSRAGDAWSILMQRHPSLVELQRSTRIARNGRIVAFDELLVDGDELALLPPVGGG